MAAVTHVLTDDEYALIGRILSDTGGVLIAPDTAKAIAEKLNVSAQSLDNLYLDAYDFFGDADVWVDKITFDEHLGVDFIEEQLNKS